MAEGTELVGNVVCTEQVRKAEETPSFWLLVHTLLVGSCCAHGGWVVHAQSAGLAVRTQLAGLELRTVGGVRGLHKVDEVHRFPTVHIIRGVHKVCGDGGGHRVGGDHGVHTACGKSEET